MSLESALANFVVLPENQLAHAAVQERTAEVGGPRSPTVFLHGPPGCGKTHLLQAVHAAYLSAREFPCFAVDEDQESTLRRLHDLREVPRLALDDVHDLPRRAQETLVQLLDHRDQHGHDTLLAGNAGPGQLMMRDQPPSARLASRLGAGVVVGIRPLGPVSRLHYLQRRSEARRMVVDPEIVAWLAENSYGAGRQLEGALETLEVLQRLQPLPLRLHEVKPHFEAVFAAQQPTLQRIVSRVGLLFQVEPKRLETPKRSVGVVLPRQIAMYLARKLTNLPLQAIGQRFGRDHTTVLHACRRIEHRMRSDLSLANTVQQLHAELA